MTVARAAGQTSVRKSVSVDGPLALHTQSRVASLRDHEVYVAAVGVPEAA